jgi:hypothetical protein
MDHELTSARRTSRCAKTITPLVSQKAEDPGEP